LPLTDPPVTGGGLNIDKRGVQRGPSATPPPPRASHHAREAGGYLEKVGGAVADEAVALHLPEAQPAVPRPSLGVGPDGKAHGCLADPKTNVERVAGKRGRRRVIERDPPDDSAEGPRGRRSAAER